MHSNIDGRENNDVFSGLDMQTVDLSEYLFSLVYSRTDRANRSRVEVMQSSVQYDMTTRRWCYKSCTDGVGGLQFRKLWSTSHCPAWLQLTWPPTVSWSPTKVVVSCILSTQGHVSSDGPAAAMETGVLLLQVRGCGTSFPLI